MEIIVTLLIIYIILNITGEVASFCVYGKLINKHNIRLYTKMLENPNVIWELNPYEKTILSHKPLKYSFNNNKYICHLPEIFYYFTNFFVSKYYISDIGRVSKYGKLHKLIKRKYKELNDENKTNIKKII